LIGIRSSNNSRLSGWSRARRLNVQYATQRWHIACLL